MFDSLKSKLKGLSRSSASKLDSEKIYEDVPEKKEETITEDVPTEDYPAEEFRGEEELDADDLDDDEFFDKLENDYFEERAKESGSAPVRSVSPAKGEEPWPESKKTAEVTTVREDPAEKRRAAAEEKKQLKAAKKDRQIEEKKAKESAAAEEKKAMAEMAARKKEKETAESEKRRLAAEAEEERVAAKKKVDEEAVAERNRIAAAAEEKRQASAMTAAEPEDTAGERPISRKEWLKRNKGKPAVAEPKKDIFTSGGMVGDSGKKIKDDPLDDLLDELEVILLESDVAYPVVQDIIIGVRDRLINRKYGRQYTLEEVVETAVKESVRGVLKINEFNFDKWFEEQPKPVVIMFVGINGTGKTTTIAKIAKRLLDRENSVVLAACDTFRAGAIEQLSIHAERLNVKIVKHQQDADPSAVAFDAIEHARSKRKDAVLLDTAGRMQTNNNLIDEMKKIARVAKPSLKIFVGDALAGNDAIEQARVFDSAIGIDAIVLTKIDTDAKGGAALSIAHTIGKPIAFVSNGQEYGDISVFDSNWMLERLFEE